MSECAGQRPISTVVDGCVPGFTTYVKLATLQVEALERKLRQNEQENLKNKKEQE
jgi:hypothetical protein